MRRLAAISLLLVFVTLTSSATSIACATNCAQMAPPATAAPVMAMPIHHHHHAMPAPASQSFAATHCAGPAPRLLAQRVVAPVSADSAALMLSVAPTVALSSRTAFTRAPFAASPPGPPVSPTQLRI